MLCEMLTIEISLMKSFVQFLYCSQESDQNIQVVLPVLMLIDFSTQQPNFWEYLSTMI